MKKLKMSFEEFIDYAKKEIAADYPKLKENAELVFVVDRHNGEIELCEYPEYVYLEMS